jgi:hypothetical protein
MVQLDADLAKETKVELNECEPLGLRFTHLRELVAGHVRVS